MNRYFRIFLYLVCIVQAFFAVAYILKLPFAVQLWPLPYTNNMSFLFIGSIFAAAAAAQLWCLLSKEDGTLAGIALDYVMIFAPISIFVLQTAGRDQTMRIFGYSCVVMALFGLGLLVWSARQPIRDTQPMPRLVRVAFAVFIVVLIGSGGQLVLKQPGILPWTISTAGSVIYGWIFLGAAAYFAYALLRPSWHNSVGQLAGFLTYDLVLIIPFLQLLPTVAPELRINLLIYIAAITTSGVLASYYLFVNPATRVVGRARPVLEPVSLAPSP
jgi:hypothetical protein